MKKQSIHDLWTIKQMVKDCPKCGTAIIEKVNKVLLEEGGAEAVLYPHEEEMDEAFMELPEEERAEFRLEDLL